MIFDTHLPSEGVKFLRSKGSFSKGQIIFLKFLKVHIFILKATHNKRKWKLHMFSINRDMGGAVKEAMRQVHHETRCDYLYYVSVYRMLWIFEKFRGERERRRRSHFKRKI